MCSTEVVYILCIYFVDRDIIVFVLCAKHQVTYLLTMYCALRAHVRRTRFVMAFTLHYNLNQTPAWSTVLLSPPFFPPFFLLSFSTCVTAPLATRNRRWISIKHSPQAFSFRRAEERSRGRRWSWALIDGWIVRLSEPR